MGGPVSHQELWCWIASETVSWDWLGFGSWAVELDGALIGQVGINKPPHFPEVELGWCILPQYIGQGYAFEAASAARDWGFAEGGLTTLVSYIDPQNQRSIALAQRLGAELDADAAAFVEQVTHDAEQPVVMFALEWCEFCWSVRKLFKKLGIPYHSVDLDSVAYQENDRGGKIRAVLKEQYGVATVPQIFVAGEHLGGATDFFAALKDGSLEPKMAAAGLDMQTLEEDFEPESLLPGWLHQR